LCWLHACGLCHQAPFCWKALDKILRIKQIASDGVLFADYDFEQCQQDDIIEFMNSNQTRLREMSLRMALKVADLVKSFPAKWRLMAETTCMKPAQ
jgi:hypothetical protein